MGLGDPFIAQMLQLEHGLKEAKRRLVLGVRKRLPITPSILQKLREVWDKLAEQQDAMGGIMAKVGTREAHFVANLFTSGMLSVYVYGTCNYPVIC